MKLQHTFLHSTHILSYSSKKKKKEREGKEKSKTDFL